MVDPNSGCWLWLGALTDGYGSFNIDHKRWSAHRASYEFFINNIPEGMQIDHKWRTRSCVNPAHLEVVTQQENIRRGETGRHMLVRTHCPSGHEYSEENTRLIDNGAGKRPSRGCKECVRIRKRITNARLKEDRRKRREERKEQRRKECQQFGSQ